VSEDFLQSGARSLEKSDIQKALEATSRPDIISFSLGRPDHRLLVLPDLQDITEELFSPSNLQYSPPSLELKTHIVDLMKEKGVFCTPEEVFLTTGAQQAMTLLAKLFASEGDHILVDQLTYPGFLQVAQALRANLIPVPGCFQKGLNMEELKGILKKNTRPSFMYTISEGHNPLGISLDKNKRIELIKIAQQYRIPLVEDDAYGFLNYEDVELPLKSYWKEGVFYIGSFSKILAPALRVGWIIASKLIIEKLEILKEGLDINTSTLSQKIINSFFAKRSLKEHISKLKEKYKNKRDTMVAALKRHIPEMEFRVPKSGFFIWGKLPSSINTNRLFKLALEEEKVSFLPGSAFLIGDRKEIQNCLRLSFAFCPIEDIEPGIKRLVFAIHKYKWINEEQDFLSF
jgi:2-aminoadipate transaminase